jgi:molybdenum cofactor cytidylyltransferase
MSLIVQKYGGTSVGSLERMRNVAAVILAAGGSSRLGRPKQLLTFRGETLVRRAVRAAAEAGCDPVIVVVGDLGDAIRIELQPTSAIIVENPDWQRGLGTSIRRGLQEVVGSIDAVVLLTCDQPLVDKAVIAELIAMSEKTGKPMVASSYANTLGVPALFDRSCFADLLALPDDSGAKTLIAARPNDVAAVAFEPGALDIDTPEDFERLTAKPD